MKSTFTLLATLVVLSLNAQYKPMANQGQQWNLLDRVSGGNSYTFVYRVAGDTTINNISYPLLTQADSNSTTSIPFAYFKEDTALGKVVIDFFDTNKREVIYDFTLMPGDSFHYQCPFIQDSGTLYLDSISVYIDSLSISRRQFNFRVYNPAANGWGYQWIEGIGSIRNFLLSLPPCVILKTSPFAQTLCISDSAGSIIYDNPNYGMCIERRVGRVELNEALPSIYPNPVEDVIRIYNLPKSENKGYIIHTLSGKQVLNGEIRNGKINTTQMLPGVYLLRIEGFSEPLKWIKH